MHFNISHHTEKIVNRFTVRWYRRSRKRCSRSFSTLIMMSGSSLPVAGAKRGTETIHPDAKRAETVDEVCSNPLHTPSSPSFPHT